MKESGEEIAEDNGIKEKINFEHGSVGHCQKTLVWVRFFPKEVEPGIILSCASYLRLFKLFLLRYFNFLSLLFSSVFITTQYSIHFTYVY